MRVHLPSLLLSEVKDRIPQMMKVVEAVEILQQLPVVSQVEHPLQDLGVM